MSHTTYHSPNSHSMFERAQRVIPGGVNSPVRAFKSVGGTPLFFQRATGALLYDLDNKPYIDFIGSWGPMIMGHAFAPITYAIIARVGASTSFGAPTEIEVEMAELVCRLVPNVDLVRMVNSGTEACMSAIRLARGYTGRNKIIKFAGCYHGHGDSFLIQAGSGAVTLGVPSSPGVTPGTAEDTLLAPYNDLAAVEALVAAHPDNIAALIIEPVAGNMGCIPPLPDFLEGLRSLCTAHGIILIFDEVMTGFRLSLGGAQERLGIDADLVTLGKIIGGGLPVGAYGGKAEIMSYVSPLGPVYQAGTLSGNPVAMAAGYALLSYLESNPEVYAQIDTQTAYLEDGWRQVLDELGIAYQINRCGSMISLHFGEHPVVDFASAQAADIAFFNAFFHQMLDEGVYLPPSAYETLFISAAHTTEHLDHAINATRKSLLTLLTHTGSTSAV
jgi:glutamate-1-semialdehyde 2,1-aminomutase